MKSKSKKYLFLLALIVSSVGFIGVIFFTPSEFSGEVEQLSLTKNSGMNCKSWSSVTDTDVNGLSSTYSPITDNFDVYTNFNVLSPKSGNVMELLDTSSYVECSPVGSYVKDFYLVGGTVKTTFYGLQENGQWITLKTVDRTISSGIQQSVYNKAQKIPSGSIYGSEINQKLTSSKEYFTTSVRVIVTSNFNFKSTATGNLLNTGGSSVSNTVPIKLYNQIIIPTQSTSTEVKLLSVSPSSFDLVNYGTSLLSVTISGQLPQWKDTEGYPNVYIYDSDRKLFGKYPMTIKQLVDSSTNTYKFTASQIKLPKAPLGYWQAEMHSNGDIRKVSFGVPSVDSILFKIYDSTPKTTTPTTTQPQNSLDLKNQCNANGKTWTVYPTSNKASFCDIGFKVSNGNLCLTKNGDTGICTEFDPVGNPRPPEQGYDAINAFIAYKLTFDQGGVVSDVVPKDDSIKITFTGLDLIGNPKSLDEKFQTMTLVQTFNTEKFTGQISNVNTDTKLEMFVDSIPIENKITLNSNQLKKINAFSLDKKFYVVNHIILSTEDISQILKSNGYHFTGEPDSKLIVDGQQIKIQTKTSGTFDAVINSVGKKAAFADLIFEYDLKFVNSFQDPDKCKGLSGEALLTCQGGDPDNCVDFVDVVGDEHCKTKEQQTGGTCYGLTPTQCAAKGKSNDNLTDDTTCSLLGTCEKNPSGSPGTVGLCLAGETSTQCLDRIKSLLPVTVPGVNLFDPVVIGLLLLGILIIVVIIVMLKRRK